MPNWPRRRASRWARSRADRGTDRRTCWATASAWPCWWPRRIRPSTPRSERVEHALIGLAVNRGAAMRAGRVALPGPPTSTSTMGRRARAAECSLANTCCSPRTSSARARRTTCQATLFETGDPARLGTRRRGPVVGVRLGARLRRQPLAREGRPDGCRLRDVSATRWETVMAETNAEAPVRTDPRYPASAVSGHHFTMRLSPGDAVKLVNISASGVLVEGKTRLRAGHARDA